MARYIDARCRLCRREGIKLFLKGLKCNTEKCPFTKRSYAPGFHGKRQTKPSYYALQLREKQKVKRIYGMMERQFRRFFYIASKSKGTTGEILIQLLERRLDNVIYRALFSSSRAQARQIVRYGYIFVGERRVNIPSYLVKEGDVLQVKGKEGVLKQIRQNYEMNSKERSVPSWLSVDKNNLKIEIIHLPQRKDVTIPINEQFIVELYSK